MRRLWTLAAGLWLGMLGAQAEPVRQDISGLAQGKIVALQLRLAERQDISGLAQGEIVALQLRLADAGCYKGEFDGAASAATKAAVKACPDQRPRLVIETGMHVAQIRRISVEDRKSVV